MTFIISRNAHNKAQGFAISSVSKYKVTYKENETEHPLFEPNNLFARVLGFHL